jgi:DNA-directed RNA polymerase subunit K/omega
MIGAMPLLANPRSHKPTRVAMEELNAGQLEYDLPDIAVGVADKDSKRNK